MIPMEKKKKKKDLHFLFLMKKLMLPKKDPSETR